MQTRPARRPLRGPQHQRGFIIDPFRSAPAGPTDPYFSQVKFLNHFNGTHGSTTFNSVVGGSMSAEAGSPFISTTESVFGGSSLRLVNPDRLKTADSATAMEIPSSTDFVNECFVYLDSVGGFNAFQDTRGSSAGWALYFNATLATFWYGGSARIAGGTAAAATWYYYCCARTSGSIYQWLGAVGSPTAAQVGAPYANGGAFNNDSTSCMRFGCLSLPFTGYIAEARLTVGTDRGTAGASTIPVPTAAFPDS